MPRLPPTLAHFLLLAVPSWPGTVDDVFTTLGYARHWAHTGVLEWTTGERVEGYSNFPFMALLSGLARVGADAPGWVVFDTPIGAGARAVVQWVPACGAPASVDVHVPVRGPLPAGDAAAPGSLRVEFTNDDCRPPVDRNLYVTLVPTSAR